MKGDERHGDGDARRVGQTEFDFASAMAEVGADTRDANGNWGLSRVQMTLFLDINGLNWGHVQDAIDRGDLEVETRSTKVRPGSEDYHERVVGYRCPAIEEGSR